VICGEIPVTNSKNIATVNFFATELSGVYVIRFAETDVNAPQLIAAAAIPASDDSDAVTAPAITAGKFAK
jgi:hypothetical protein